MMETLSMVIKIFLSSPLTRELALFVLENAFINIFIVRVLLMRPGLKFSRKHVMSPVWF